MRPVLLSLALLGTTARGCFFRGDAPRDPPSTIERIHLGNLRGGPIPGEPLVTHQAEELSVRERRVVGKRDLKEACSDNVEFERCHRDKGSALQLEECLRKRSRTISGTCLEGIETWKTLLAETSPGARHRRPAEDKGSQPPPRPVRVDLGKASLEDELWAFNDADSWLVEEDAAFQPYHSLALLGGRPDHGPFGGGGPRDDRPPSHHRDGAPWEHHPPPRHFGKGPRVGPPAGHPDHTVAGPSPRPSMFSVLADWLFATSDDSSSDDFSIEDSSSSDDFSIEDSSSDDSSGDDFFDGFDAGFGAGFDAGIGMDAGFFPAGHPRPISDRRGRFRGGVKLGIAMEDDDSMLLQTPPLERLDLQVTGPFRGDSDEDFLRQRPPQTRPLSSKKGRPFGRPARPAHAEGMPLEIDVFNARLADGMVLEESSGSGGQMRPQQHARRPGGLPGPRHDGGDRGSRDHIRFRNRHPEDRNGWFADSFDSAEDFDLVEGVLALFFFIGSVTLLLLPFFLLARALKRLVRRASGSGDDAPDGYQALPEDAAAAAAAAVSASGQQRGGNARDDDDDAIVVTGTPVNPPPSVHL